MTIEQVVLDPVNNIAVFQFELGAGSSSGQPQPYALAAGTVIVCEETDVIHAETSYLRPFALFFIKHLPNNVPGPMWPNLYATTACNVGPNPVIQPQSSQPPTTKFVETCSLCVLDGSGPSTIGTVQLAPGAIVTVDHSRITSPPHRIKANSVFMVKFDPTHTEGPYIFTDHDIPLNILEDD